MSTKYKFQDNEKLYFVSFSTVYWIDVFIRNEYKEILLDSWKYCIKQKGLEVYSWCIMTSHAHMIIGSNGEKMENIMRDMKKHTSIELHKAIRDSPGESRKNWILWMMKRAGEQNSNNSLFQFWQQSNHPIQLNNSLISAGKLQYIHNNPVVAGFVDRPEHYLYSSARDYCGIKGLLDISLLDPVVRWIS